MCLQSCFHRPLRHGLACSRCSQNAHGVPGKHVVDDALREVVCTSERLLVNRPLKSVVSRGNLRVTKLFELSSWVGHLQNKFDPEDFGN